MKFFLAFALMSLLSFHAIALSSMEAEEQYHAFSDDLKEGEVPLELINGSVLSNQHKKILVDSLWDHVIDPANSKDLKSAIKVWKNLDFNSMPLAEQLRIYLLGINLKVSSAELDNMSVVLSKKLRGKTDNRSLIILFNFSAILREQGLGEVLDEVEVANLKFKLEYDAIVSSAGKDLADQDLREVFASRTLQKVMIYLACRSDRNWPCLILLKDRKGKLMNTAEGDLWTLPALGKSRFKLPFHFENGHTPSGLYRVDSVMPLIDRKLEYGNNRRLILRMASKTDVIKLLPQGQHKKAWWRQVLLALELGRENLRIHGTGKVNDEPGSLHPELVASSGCIKLREGTYNGTVYNDQRILLNTLMKAQGISVSRNNEAAIRADLLVFNVPGTGPVKIEDLQEYIELQE